MIVIMSTSIVFKMWWWTNQSNHIIKIIQVISDNESCDNYLSDNGESQVINSSDYEDDDDDMMSNLSVEGK